MKFYRIKLKKLLHREVGLLYFPNKLSYSNFIDWFAKLSETQFVHLNEKVYFNNTKYCEDFNTLTRVRKNSSTGKEKKSLINCCKLKV